MSGIKFKFFTSWMIQENDFVATNHFFKSLDILYQRF